MPTDPLLGKKMGDYTIESLLGRGGMARVYQGYDANLDRYAAVKVIDSFLINSEDSDEYYERFQREARAIARLRHPNIVGVYQFGQYEDQVYMAMVFIEGQDLRFVLKEHVANNTLMAPALALKIMQAMTDALDYAHREGVIHRDVKPSNILVMEDGTAVLTDFGLALNTSDGTIGNTFGSAHYIAPEQAVSSANAVPQSDMYSLAICLYEMLTGRVPFDDNSAMSVALKHLSDPPPPPRQLNPDIPVEVEQVILRALEKEPEDRYETLTEFYEALKAAFETTELHTLGDTNVKGSIPRPVDLGTATSAEPTPRSRPSIPRPRGSSPSDSEMRQRSRERAASSQPSVVADRLKRRARGGGGGRRIAVIVTSILGVVALIGGVFFGLSAAGLLGGETTPTPVATTEVAVLDASTDAMTEAAMTTDTATETETEEATATDLPATDTLADTEAAINDVTSVPTATPVPPTATPEPTATPTEAIPPSPTRPSALPPDAVTITLRYNEQSFMLFNSSQQDVDVSRIVFYRDESDGSRNEVSVQEIWRRGNQSPNDLPPGDCFQTWTTRFVNLPAPDYCTRQAFYAIANGRDFWFSEEAIPFNIELSGEVIATCPPVVAENRADRECNIQVPPSR